MKKFLCIIMSALILTTLMSVSVSAATTYTKTKPKDQTFKKAWDVTETITDTVYGIPIGAIQWGFDTVFVNEDYVYTRGKDGHKSQAKLKQGDNSVINGRIANANYLSDIMEKHRSDTVKYYIVIY